MQFCQIWPHFPSERLYRVESAYFPKVSPTEFVLIFSFCQSDRQEEVSQSCFHLHFFMSELEHFLRYLRAIYTSCFCELSVHFFSIPCPSILRVLYTLRILTSCLWNILPTFSSRLSFVFDFVYGVVFFAMKIFKNVYVFKLTILFILLPLHFESLFRKPFPVPKLKTQSPCLPMLLVQLHLFTFRSLIHLEFVLVYGVRCGFNFTLSQRVTQ